MYITVFGGPQCQLKQLCWKLVALFRLEISWSVGTCVPHLNVVVGRASRLCQIRLLHEGGKLLHPELKYIKSCWKSKDNLYVVTDIVELISDTVLRYYSSWTPFGKTHFSITFGKGEVQGGIFRKNEKVLTLMKGMVMAYKTKRLIFEEKDRTILITDDDERSIFQYVPFFSIPIKYEELRCEELCPVLASMLVVELAALQSSPVNCEELRRAEPCQLIPPRRIEEPHQQDFNRLQEEVSRNIEALAQLSKDAQGVVFSSILDMLRHRENLQDLMYMLILGNSSHLDGHGGAILKMLQQDSNHALSESKEPILNLLEAIMVLSDIQQDLLAYSMEKRILLQQQDLVRSILEPNFRYPWSIPFTLKPELLAPLQGEDLAVTYDLLEECGLRMELCSSPRSTWDLTVKMPLSALYGTLSLLQQLAEA
ncbi:hypothetical protein P7K49_026396 [Saguinus oedipus]|uniref:Uncharacterized protein n=1 Tax=Saguinus oedipus TaxID=9490 RepID=A0ABQ9UE15_SAGOE|nr:hypothetical protein P7K49_026396 [Saguinus oedipus]